MYYVEDRIRRIFGKDEGTRAWNEQLKKRWHNALEQARSVQCIGMHRPISIEQIYQPVAVYRASAEWQQRISSVPVRLDDLLKKGTDAVIIAGPGRGKSTLLNWLFVQSLKNDGHSAFLFILRTENATEDLEVLVDKLASGRRPDAAKHPILLLVDGYDEVDESLRKRVSAALNHFKSAGLGNFLLTCRTFYEIYDLRVQRYILGDLTEQDAVNFVAAFSAVLEQPIDGQALVTELTTRKLKEFARHPLLLTLTCILKTGARPDLPQNALALLKRAFDTLTFRWDEQKGVARQSILPLDGEDRISCMMHLAFHMQALQEKAERMEALARNFLTLTPSGRQVDPRKLLLEIARWYGILVQPDAGHWQFAHRCIHDYLAARFMVENGRFDPQKIVTWTTRIAYAACLQYDATDAIKLALKQASGLQAFTECLYNRARFQPRAVANAVIDHFCRYGGFLVTKTGNHLTAQTEKAIFSLAGNSLLQELVGQALSRRPVPKDSSQAQITDPFDLVCVYAMAELHKRKRSIPNPNTLRNALAVYGRGTFSFQIGVDIESRYTFRLSQVFAKELQGMIQDHGTPSRRIW